MNEAQIRSRPGTLQSRVGQQVWRAICRSTKLPTAPLRQVRPPAGLAGAAATESRRCTAAAAVHRPAAGPGIQGGQSRQRRPEFAVRTRGRFHRNGGCEFHRSVRPAASRDRAAGSPEPADSEAVSVHAGGHSCRRQHERTACRWLHAPVHAVAAQTQRSGPRLRPQSGG